MARNCMGDCIVPASAHNGRPRARRALRRMARCPCVCRCGTKRPRQRIHREITISRMNDVPFARGSISSRYRPDVRARLSEWTATARDHRGSAFASALSLRTIESSWIICFSLSLSVCLCGQRWDFSGKDYGVTLSFDIYGIFL